ncbi:hypothetical protein GEMRC1_010129 [Eukaryota sp. GEM-RC1]
MVNLSDCTCRFYQLVSEDLSVVIDEHVSKLISNSTETKSYFKILYFFKAEFERLALFKTSIKNISEDLPFDVVNFLVSDKLPLPKSESLYESLFLSKNPKIQNFCKLFSNLSQHPMIESDLPFISYSSKDSTSDTDYLLFLQNFNNSDVQIVSPPSSIPIDSGDAIMKSFGVTVDMLSSVLGPVAYINYDNYFSFFNFLLYIPSQSRSKTPSKSQKPTKNVKKAEPGQDLSGELIHCSFFISPILLVKFRNFNYSQEILDSFSSQLITLTDLIGSKIPGSISVLGNLLVSSLLPLEHMFLENLLMFNSSGKFDQNLNNSNSPVSTLGILKDSELTTQLLNISKTLKTKSSLVIDLAKQRPSPFTIPSFISKNIENLIYCVLEDISLLEHVLESFSNSIGSRAVILLTSPLIPKYLKYFDVLAPRISIVFPMSSLNSVEFLNNFQTSLQKSSGSITSALRASKTSLSCNFKIFGQILDN